MSDKPSAEGESIPRLDKKSSNIYFIQVKGNDDEAIRRMANGLDDLETDDNIVVIPETVEPIDRGAVKVWLSQLANALDMEIVDK